VRARIDLPFNYQSRDKEVTYLGTETSGTGTTTSAVIDTNTYPYDYTCSEGTTKVAAVDNFNLTVEAAGATFGGVTVTDRSLPTAATPWTDGGDAESLYKLTFGPYGAGCSPSGVKEGCLTSGNTFSSGGDDYYKFYIISSKYQGELKIKDENIKYALPVGIRSQFMDSPSFLGEEHHSLIRAIIDNINGTLPKNPASGSNYTGGVKYREIIEEFYSCSVYEGAVTMDAVNSPLYGNFSTGDLCYDQRDESPYGKIFAGKDNSLTATFTPYTDKPMFIKIPTVSRSYPNNTY
jgi:hypothetical protein